MTAADSLALLLWALTTFTVFTLLLDLIRYDLRLDTERGPELDGALITVIVPMRNEVDNANRCLTAVRSQSYRNLEVIVVDDGSTDGTAEILAEFQRDWPSLRVVTLEGEPPLGWAGKTNAMHRGVHEATGEWLLFIDADVVLGEHSVATAVGAAKHKNWPVLSLTGHVVRRSFWDVALLLPVGVLTHLFQVEMPCTVLNGQFILIRRTTYDAVGGFASVRGAVVEDAALASRLLECGVRPRVRVWTEAFRCRMYESRSAMWEGLTRMLAGYNRFRAGPLVAIASIYGAVLLPQMALAWLLVLGATGAPVSAHLAAAAGSLFTVHLACWLVIARRLGAPLAACLLKPMADLNVMAVLLDSARRCAFGGVKWRGRSYAAKPLPAPERSKPAPIPVSSEGPPRLTIVIPPRRGVAADNRFLESSSERASEFVRRHPEIEVIAVHRGPCPEIPSEPENLHLLRVQTESYWQSLRAGFEAARAPIVGVLDAVADDLPSWMESVLAAFDDPEISLVTGPVRYHESGARAVAASIREWGHLSDAWTAYPSPENFAGRRELMLRVLPNGGPGRAEGGVLLGMLAAIEGSPFLVIPDAGARVSTRSHPIVPSMAARLVAATSLTDRAARWADRRPSLTRLGVILMPLTVSADTALLTLRVPSRWFRRFELPYLRRAAVLAWLSLFSALDLALAGSLAIKTLLPHGGAFADDASGDRPEWHNRILGIVHRMLASPRHRRAPSGLVAID
jgi:cellulose synthase/poly-beta-1,6-N-acetylglucosamine synthase-like glycosyltransferase